MSSDGGVILLKQVDDHLGLRRRFAACFRDERHPGFIEYQVEDLVRQRIMGLALGYEDLNDHDALRQAVCREEVDPSSLRSDYSLDLCLKNWVYL